ncbi:hypothetical protein CAL7716_064990 [Calothrix sp. PCC 7716]|nr:hypothetical protein CAL7716_064990 [Calothrix sp. PCC 7716]
MPQIIENTQPTFNNQQLPGAQKLNLVPLKISYSFDYERFANPDLEGRAKNTLGNFLGFMRYTFDGFISIGQALQNFYIDCLTSCPDGKKVFDEWLDRDFAASKYIASSSMKFHGWFQNLHPRVQDLLRSRIQNWSISAISLLMKASEEILEELVSAESEQRRYLEIKGAAISDAKKEIASFEKHAQNMTDKVSMLVKQLEEKEQEIARLNSLHVENQQLQQRVTELENALLKASEDSWGNTFNTQAQKVLNKDVEQKAALLLSEVEQLKASVKEKDTLIAQMLHQASISDSDFVISEFGEIAKTLGWNGWRRSGYRDKNGTLHKGMNAISAFVSDLTHEYQYY